MRLELIKICPGKRHAWFNSNYGVIRKPLTEVDYTRERNQTGDGEVQSDFAWAYKPKGFWARLVDWLKSLWQ